MLHKKAGFLCGRRLREKATTDGEHQIAMNRAGRCQSYKCMLTFLLTASLHGKAFRRRLQICVEVFFQGSSFGPTFVSFLSHSLNVETRAALKVTQTTSQSRSRYCFIWQLPIVPRDPNGEGKVKSCQQYSSKLSGMSALEVESIMKSPMLLEN